MNPPRVYTCSPSWTPLPPPSPYHPSGSSQCTSPKHPVSCTELGLVIHFIYDIIYVSMPFSQIIPPSPSPTESKRLFYISSILLPQNILFQTDGIWQSCSFQALGMWYNPSQASLHFSAAHGDRAVPCGRAWLTVESQAPWQLLEVEMRGQGRKLGWERVQGRSGRITWVLIS